MNLISYSWEQRKLNELGKIETGNTPSTSISKYYCEEGLPWITPTDITSNLTTKTEVKKKCPDAMGMIHKD